MRALLLFSFVTLCSGCVFRTAVPLDGGVSLIACSEPKDCPKGLSCSAALGLCYDPSAITVDAGVSGLPCESRFDCPRPLTCANDFGFCVQADEVAVDAEGTTSLTCLSRGGCPAPLACALALGRCVSVPAVQTDGGLSLLPCTTSSDCVGTLVCAAGLHRCVDPDGLVVEGGLSFLPCSTTSECVGALVCANGLRRCANPDGLVLDAGISVLPCTTSAECVGTLVCARGLGACANVEKLPLDDAGVSLVPCQFTDDCPAPLACSSRAGLCVDTTRSQLPVIRSAQLVDAAGQVVTRRSGVAPFDRGQVLVELQLPPVALSARFRTTEASCAAITPTSWVCPLTFSGPSGSEIITLLASDLRGVAVTERLSVTIDADWPRVISGTEVVTIVPATNNPLVPLGPAFAPTAARVDSTVRVTLLLDDPNTTSATLFLGAGATQLPFVRRVGQSFVFEGALPASVPEGDITLELTAVDDVGNRSPRMSVAARLRKDTAAPPSPNVATDDGVIVERVPLGDGTRVGAFVRMRLSPPDGLLVFREGPGAPVVLTLRATGGMVEGQVSVVDQEQLTAQALDEAGNASAEVQVRRFRLFVHPGRTANQTHVATTTDLVFAPPRSDQPLAMPLLEAADQSSVQVQPVPRWELLHDGLDAGPPSGSPLVSLIEDAPRRRLLRIVSDSFGAVATDLANGRHVVTNLQFTPARYEGACHTSRRTCLLVGTPPAGNSRLWALDDQGARLLRTLTTTSASITFDARREVFLLAEGTALLTLDESGSTLSTGTSDCNTTPCNVVATPRGVLSAAASTFVWRHRDGGTVSHTGTLNSGHLGLDRSTLEPFIVEPQVSQLRADGTITVIGPAACAIPQTCEAAWDPVAATVTIINRSTRSVLMRDGGAVALDVSPDRDLMASWAIAEPNGFVLPGTGRWRYQDPGGWAASTFTPSHCGLLGNTIPLGIAIDGGWMSPCGRRTTLTSVADVAVPGFPFFSSWTVTLGNSFVTTNGLWRDGQLIPLSSSSSSEPLALPPERLLYFPGVTITRVFPDGGSQPEVTNINGQMPLAPRVVSFSPVATLPPFDLWMLTGGPAMPTAFTRLTLMAGGPGLTGEYTPVPLPPVAPTSRLTPLVVPRPAGRFLLYGGQVPDSALQWTNEVWALHTQVRPTVHWSVDTARFNVPLDGLLGVSVSTTLKPTDAGIPPTEVLVWDPWRTSWQVVGSLDGGAVGGGAFVPASSVFDVAVSRLPTSRDPLDVDRLGAVIDYRR